MTDEAPVQEDAPAITSRTTRFAEWLMAREERRQEKESNLEGLIKMNLIVSFLTLAMVGGFEAVRTALTLVPYL